VAVFFFWLVSEHQVLGTNIKSKALSGDVVEIANGETLCHPTFPHTIHIERDDWIVRRVTPAIRNRPAEDCIRIPHCEAFLEPHTLAESGLWQQRTT